jgi:hypothetical protein
LKINLTEGGEQEEEGNRSSVPFTTKVLKNLDYFKELRLFKGTISTSTYSYVYLA